MRVVYRIKAQKVRDETADERRIWEETGAWAAEGPGDGWDCLYGGRSHTWARTTTSEGSGAVCRCYYGTWDPGGGAHIIQGATILIMGHNEDEVQQKLQ